MYCNIPVPCSLSYINLAYCHRYWKEELTRKKCGGEIQLWWVILKCLWWRIMLAGTLTAFQVRMPLYDHYTVSYFMA